MKKTVKSIREDLFVAYEDLRKSYIELPGSNEETINYIEIELCEKLMSSIKSLEYHHLQAVPRYRIKKTWTYPLVRAFSLLKKYGEPKDSKNLHAGYNLQKKYDASGYIEHKDILDGLLPGRESLKRKL